MTQTHAFIKRQGFDAKLDYYMPSYASPKQRVKITRGQRTKFPERGAFGMIGKRGVPVLGKSDVMEVELLAALSANVGRYVFKHRNGRYGYLDESGEFVVMDEVHRQ